ncbi:MAG: 50S ribosomal protein L18 [Candidatus Komeilibacteria bacterium]|nr:50S ribosomal protein L18 [Candidatus Komeilibacteria bacterium]
MKDSSKLKNKLRARRVIRVRSRIFGTAVKPRLAVFKSLKHLSVQAINDESGKTLASASDREVKGETKLLAAKALGEAMAKKLAAQGLTAGVFDKRHYKYHGLVKAVAEGLRAGNLKI